MQPHSLLVAAFVAGAALPLASATPAANMTAQTTFRCWRYRAGFDIRGMDFDSAYGGGPHECWFRCIELDGCKTFTYSWDDNTCYFKWGMSVAAYKPHVTSAVQLIYEGNDCPRLHFLVGNCDLRGHDVSNFPASDSSGCRARALEKELSYTWSDDNGGTCWLKSFESHEMPECISAVVKDSGVYAIQMDF